MPTISRTLIATGLLSLGANAQAQTTAEVARADEERTTYATSRDGTRIAYETAGKGPAIILVNGALSDRSSGAELAQLLAIRFTVYSYDRRGRGGSADTKPYSLEREIEDLDAVIESAGGSAQVYGKSSGASLALQAAATLGDKIGKLALYEPPYSDAAGAAREGREFRVELDALLAADRRAEAVTRFMKFTGAPDDVLAKMKASPAWPGMVKMAPTLAHDSDVVGDERAVPVAVATRVKATTLVMDGGASVGPMPFMRATADKLGEAIPHARRLTVEGQAHNVSAEVMAPILLKFFD